MNLPPFRIDGYTTVTWYKLLPDSGCRCGRCRKDATMERRTLNVRKTKKSLASAYFCDKHFDGLHVGTRQSGDQGGAQ